MKGSGKEDFTTAVFSAALIGSVLFILISAFLGIRESVWTNAYCTALGGERISAYTCEVDGRVVRV